VFQLLFADRLECNARLAKPITAEQLRGQFGMMIMDPQLRLLILPVLTRILRCNDADVAALDFFFAEKASPSLPTVMSNELLMFTVGYSELWAYQHTPLDAAQLRNMQLGMYFASDSGGQQILDAASAPGFSPYNDTLVNSYPDTNVNLLMVQGALDPQTPPEWAEHAKTMAYTGTNQHLVRVPHAVHVPATLPNRSPTTNSGEDCGLAMAASFFASGGQQPPDAACLERLAPPDFAGFEPATQAMSVALLGTVDMWGEGPLQRETSLTLV
jgi:hypothetical protein